MADRDGGPRADPPTSAQGDDYPVFLGDTLVAELLVNKALAMTEAERAACALGRIAERLTDLHEELWVIGHDIYQAIDRYEEKLAKLAADLPPPPPNERQAVHQIGRATVLTQVTNSILVFRILLGKIKHSNTF